MQHFKSLEGLYLPNSWLTIGTFDGVHLGHQEIIGRLVHDAHEMDTNAVVLTFFPHPAIVLGKRQDPQYLTTPDERADVMKDLGVDFVVTYPFDEETANTPARDFISLLHTHLHFKGLCVGYDFAFGKNREGNSVTLTKYGEEIGFQVRFINAVHNGDLVVSSSRIRSRILEGEVEQAAQLLGRFYRIKGKVIAGDGRGKLIGVPTANLETWTEQAIPKAGVYATFVNVREQSYRGVVNIGVRPTFEQGPVIPRVEVHILKFEQEIYGEEIVLNFVSRLRDERRFQNVEALVEQIQTDIAQAEQLLS